MRVFSFCRRDKSSGNTSSKLYTIPCSVDSSQMVRRLFGIALFLHPTALNLTGFCNTARIMASRPHHELSKTFRNIHNKCDVLFCVGLPCLCFVTIYKIFKGYDFVVQFPWDATDSRARQEIFESGCWGTRKICISSFFRGSLQGMRLWLLIRISCDGEVFVPLQTKSRASSFILGRILLPLEVEKTNSGSTTSETKCLFLVIWKNQTAKISCKNSEQCELKAIAGLCA